MSKVIAAMQSGQLPMPTTEPAANPQALTEAAKLAAWIRSLEERQIPLEGRDQWATVVLLSLSLEQRDLVLGLLDGALSGPAAATDADMRAFGASYIACYKWPDGTPEHRAARAAYCEGAYDAVAADRGQIVEECARVAERYNDGVGLATARGIARAIRALSPAPAQTEDKS